MQIVEVLKRMHQAVLALLMLAGLLFAAAAAAAQNLGYEGPTGVFVTPLAATAASPAKGFGKPVIATHALAGGSVLGTFTTYSITEGFGKRFEFGYTRESHDQVEVNGYNALWVGGLNIVHAKVNFLAENAGKTKWVPGMAVGGILRTNDNYVGNGKLGQTSSNGDLYLVATKIIPQTGKVPLVLNAGVRGTNASLWGLGGNAPSWTARAFGAVAFVFTGPRKSAIILGSEIAQQPKTILVGGAAAFRIPTSVDYAIRVVPSPKHKINLDAGVLQGVGRIAPGVNLKGRARWAFGVSYGF